MKNTCRTLCAILIVSIFSVAAAGTSYALSGDISLGNSDINILNGGLLLNSEGVFYYSENGAIYRESGEETVLLYKGEARNLNYAAGYIYFTDNGSLLRIPEDGGADETVFKHGELIKQLYVIDASVARYVSGGCVYEYSFASGSTNKIAGRGEVLGLIPTFYGDILLSGEVFDYSVLVNGKMLLKGVTGCYTDSGYLAVSRDGHNYMVGLERLFNGFEEQSDLLDFDIHGSISVVELFGSPDENNVCAVCEANSAFGVRLFEEASENENEDEPGKPFTPPTVSQGQKSIVLRARQMSEIKWTPLEDRYQWGYNGVFKAETTYTGLPYGQPINTGYVPWTVSYQAYLNAVNDNTSVFYSKYSEYNKIAPAYSCDCSSYVSAAWGLKNRLTTYYLPTAAQRISDQSIYGMQTGDCLNHSTSHVVLVSDVRYNENGEITGIDIMEQTPVITRKTSYGESGDYPLSRIQSYYLNGGYVLYRNPDRDGVAYTHDCAVPIDGDYCHSCKATPPKTKTTAATGSKTVALSHENANAVIYYTLDGTVPTTSSATYAGPITFTSTTKLRAIAATPEFSGSTILEYTVKLPPVSKPEASVLSGQASGNVVLHGTRIELKTGVSDASIYYTTDGTDPTSGSNKYTAPITITSDIVIKCFAEAVGMSRSDTSVFDYKVGRAFSIYASAGTGGGISPSGTVSALETTSMTFAITPSPGYATESVVIDGTNHGAISEYTFSNISGDHTITANFKEINMLPFADVLESDWFFSAVNNSYKKGLFYGTSATEFSPNGAMTRGMFITVLGRLAGVPAIDGNIGIVTASGVNIRSQPNTSSDILGVCGMYTCVKVISENDGWHKIQTGNIVGYIRNDLIISGDAFSDTAAGIYYTPYVQWAGLLGIESANNGTFSAEKNITREEMSLLLYNYANRYGISLNRIREAPSFSDEYLMSPAGKTAIAMLYTSGVLNGMGDGSFDPNSGATRAQVAQIFTAYLKAIS